MWLTQKKQDELYDAAVDRARQRLRSLEPRSIASRMYPNLKSVADEQPRIGLFMGWGHLNRSQKEK